MAELKPGLRTHEGASLLLSPVPGLPDLLQITRLQTRAEDRRKGHAKALLKAICLEADETGTPLMLEPRPFGVAPMDEIDLQIFYNRFGFTHRIKDQHGNEADFKGENGETFMLRVPR